jgi:hypothetical protein
VSQRPCWLLDAPHGFDDALRLEPLVERAVWLPAQPSVQPWPVVEPGPLVASDAMRGVRMARVSRAAGTRGVSMTGERALLLCFYINIKNFQK